MGSFLYTCMSSNQTIIEEMDVIIMPIVQKTGYRPCKLTKGKKEISAPQAFESNVYANCFWSAAGMYFQGYAEDYGRQVLYDTEKNRISLLILLSMLEKEAYTTEAGENQYHEKGFDFKKIINKYKSFNKFFPKDPKDKEQIKEDTLASLNWNQCLELWEEIHELIMKNQVFVTSYSGEPRQLSLAVTLQDSFDYLSKNFKDSFTYERFKERFDKEKELIVNMVKDKKTKKAIKEAMSMGRRFFHLSIETSGEATDLRYATYERYLNDYYEMSSNPAVFTDKNTQEAYFEDLEYIFKFSHFQSALFSYGITISPVIYSGQDYQNDKGSNYSKFVQEMEAKVKTFIDEKYGEYE